VFRLNINVSDRILPSLYACWMDIVPYSLLDGQYVQNLSPVHR
jgi:hypothetical protein